MVVFTFVASGACSIPKFWLVLVAFKAGSEIPRLFVFRPLVIVPLALVLTPVHLVARLAGTVVAAAPDTGAVVRATIRMV
ncbi:hypothetical protein D3C80_1373560 [compost metagenome]